jgi:hypothetical protein
MQQVAWIQYYENFRFCLVGFVTEVWLKLESRGLDSRWGHWISSIDIQPYCGPGVGTASNSSDCQESSWGLKGGRPARKADNVTMCEPIV